MPAHPKAGGISALQVYSWELRDRQRFGKVRAERLPRDQTRVRFSLVPMAPAWRLCLVAASMAAPFVATAVTTWQDAQQ